MIVSSYAGAALPLVILNMNTVSHFKRGDWAAQAGVRQPDFGRVVDVFIDSDGECINVKLYDLKGNVIGRKSPAMGGPATFEPACPATQWRKIQRPEFPIERVGLYGDYDYLLKSV